MGANTAFILTLYLCQSLGALVLAGLFARYYRLYRRPALLLWAWSFAAAMVYVLGAGGGYAMSLLGLAAEDPLRLASALLSLVGAYVHLVMLGLGALAMIRDDFPARPLSIALLSSAAVLGVISALSWAWTPEAVAERIFLRVGLRYLLTGLVFAAVGIALLWVHRQIREPAQRLVGATMLLFGLQALNVFGVYFYQYWTSQSVAWAMALGSVDLLAMLLIGLALLIWLLERERSRVEVAQLQIERLVRFDPLTGLLRRETLAEEMAQTTMVHAEAAEGSGVLYINLEGFALINDSIGHHAGDVVLIETAERLGILAQYHGAMASRLDGDRFALACPQLGGSAAAARLARAVEQSIAQPMRISGRDMELSCRIGIALYPGDGDNAEALLRSAELATREAGPGGRQRVRFASAELNAYASERMELQQQLREALKLGQFELYYQPQLNLSSRAISGVEALLRWNHPKRGVLGPDFFLDALSEFNLIHEVDLWVLETGCLQLARWQQQGQQDLRLAINLSPRSFRDPLFGSKLEAILGKAGLNPRSLELEITESTALTDVDSAIEILLRMRELGVLIALDDFGVGHSSLSQLRRLPVDTVKIDRSFVRDLLTDAKDQSIINAMVALAQSLGLGVVAEGVENEAQAQRLRSCGVEVAQGFLFARPLTRIGFEHFLRAGMRQHA